jgi:hypothetical protein
MQHIDVSDLPDPIARAIQTIVQTLRQQLVEAAAIKPRTGELPRWEGQVIGNLTREEIYDDDV